MPEKTFTNVDVASAKSAISDLKVTGNGDMFQLLCKASSETEGWMKSTKAMLVPGGVVIQVTTQQKNQDGSYVVAEAVTFVPGAIRIEPDIAGGRKLVAEK